MSTKQLILYAVVGTICVALALGAYNHIALPWLYRDLHGRFSADVEKLRVEFHTEIAVARQAISAEIDAAAIKHETQAHRLTTGPEDLGWIRDAFLEAASQRGQIISQVERVEKSLTDAVLEARGERRRMNERIEEVERQNEDEP